jgi:HEAT repeat protein
MAEELKRKRKILRLLSAVVVLACITTTGCAEFKTYMKDRSNDLADCFTVRAGLSTGLGVRTQITNFFSVSAGGSFEEEKSGYFGRAPVNIKGFWVGEPFLTFMAFRHVGESPFSPGMFTDVRRYEDRALPAAMGLTLLGGLNVVELQPSNENYRMKPPTPFLREKFFIEVSATLGVVGFDLGFNPVEFVDFLLGWFGADVAGDDTGGRYDRLNAVIAMQKVPDSADVDFLIKALEDRFWRVRQYAAKALGNMKAKQAVAPLAELLKDDYCEVRLNAVDALGKIGASKTIELFAGVLKEDKGFRVREAAVRVLVEIGDVNVAEPLIAALQDNHSSVSSVAAEALGEIGDKRAVEPLAEALQTRDRKVFLAAGIALAKLDRGRAQEALREILALRTLILTQESHMQSYAVQVLEGIGDDQAVTLLIEALKVRWVGHSAAEALGRIGNKRAVGPLIEALKDKRVLVRLRAAIALGKIGDGKAVAEAVTSLIGLLKSEERWERRDAARALKNITGQDFGEDYKKWKKWYEENKDK